MSKKSPLFQFTQAELDRFVKDENSCVKRVPSKMHIGFPPYGLENFKDTLLDIISKKKIGVYDSESRGIVLDVRNIKLEGTMSMIRYDSPELHLNIHANFYVFQPRLGALLKGVVKHISKRHVSALIYNVFNVSIRLNGDFMRKLTVNKEISFRVKKFDLQNVLPYIEGELVAEKSGGADDENADSGISGGGDSKSNKKVTFGDSSSTDSSDDDSEDEKAFKNLVVKTETMTKKVSKKDSSSSSSSSDEDEEDVKPKVPLPVPIVKKEDVKSASTSKSTSKSSSSSDESSSEEEEEPAAPAKSLPKPVPIVKSEKKDTQLDEDSSSTASESSISEDEAAAAKIAEKFPPSQFHTSKAASIALKQESSSSDSESSSDEEQFKIPMPIVKMEGGQVVIKREITPSRRLKTESSSSASEAEGKSPAAVRKKILQSPLSTPTIQSTPVPPDFSVKVEPATPSKKNKKSPTKEKSTQAKETNAAIQSPKKRKSGQSVDNSESTPPVKKPKLIPPPPPVKEESSSSDDDSDDQFNSSVNLNSSIQNLVSKIYTTKMAKKTSTNKKAKSNGKGDEVDTPVEAKKKSKKAKASEGDLSKCFGSDILSSTRLDLNSPVAKPKKKKVKE